MYIITDPIHYVVPRYDELTIHVCVSVGLGMESVDLSCLCATMNDAILRERSW